MYVCMYACMHACMYVNVCTYVRTYVCACMYVCMYVCICMYVCRMHACCICFYVYVGMCILVYDIYIYTYMYICKERMHLYSSNACARAPMRPVCARGCVSVCVCVSLCLHILMYAHVGLHNDLLFSHSRVRSLRVDSALRRPPLRPHTVPEDLKASGLAGLGDLSVSFSLQVSAWGLRLRGPALDRFGCRMLQSCAIVACSNQAAVARDARFWTVSEAVPCCFQCCYLLD